MLFIIAEGNVTESITVPVLSITIAFTATEFASLTDRIKNCSPKAPISHRRLSAAAPLRLNPIKGTVEEVYREEFGPAPETVEAIFPDKFTVVPVSNPDRVTAAALTVPEKVGLADIATFPVPVIAFDTSNFEPFVNTACEADKPDNVADSVYVGLTVKVCASDQVYAPEIVVAFPITPVEVEVTTRVPVPTSGADVITPVLDIVKFVEDTDLNT